MDASTRLDGAPRRARMRAWALGTALGVALVGAVAFVLERWAPLWFPAETLRWAPSAEMALRAGFVLRSRGGDWPQAELARRCAAAGAQRIAVWFVAGDPAACERAARALLLAAEGGAAVSDVAVSLARHRDPAVRGSVALEVLSPQNRIERSALVDLLCDAHPMVAIAAADRLRLAAPALAAAERTAIAQRSADAIAAIERAGTATELPSILVMDVGRDLADRDLCIAGYAAFPRATLPAHEVADVRREAVSALRELRDALAEPAPGAGAPGGIP